MNIDLGGGRRLLLADLGAGGWAWIAVGLAALVLLVVLYRYERRLVPRGAGLTLLGLRLLAALALVAAMLDPIAARTFTESVRGRLIVGVDRSESMETADPGRPEADRAALGSLLGLSPADNPSRLEVARRLLDGEPGLAAKLEADHTVEPIGFARSSAPGALAALAARPAEGTAAGATDWGPVLEAGLREGPDGAPVLGVVLLTDGRRNLPPGGTDEAARLAELGVPVFPILIGSTIPPRDAAVAAVRAPETVYLGDAATVSVEVKADGFEPGAPVVVRLEREGAEPMEQVVRAPGPGEPARPLATFRVELPEPGTHALTVSVSPPGGADLRPDNDRRERVVQVVDDKARVLLVEGEARWEFRYLRNALARDPRVEVDSVLLIPPPAPDGAERSYPDRLPAAPAAGSDQPDPLGAYDVIVLGDLPPSAAPADLWERLDAFVSARGGALIVSAGPRSWPDGWSGDERAAGMLPVAAPRKAGRAASAGERQGPWPGGARVVPASLAAAEPEQWPMLQFAAEPAASLAVWEGLPPLPWALAGRPKPGAVVLAAAVGDGPADDSAAVIATHAYGLGKVLWIGTDGTWRWRLRVGDAYHHRFWGQLVRWAAGGKLSAGNRLVRFGPDRARTPEGEPPTFQARFSEAAPGVTPSLLAAARVVRAGEGEGAEAVALVPLRGVADRPGVFEGLPPALPPGSYVARLEVPELEAAFRAEGLEAPEAAFEVVERETTERIELAASRDALEGLASATGGRVLADFEAGGLPDLLRSRVVEKSRTEESALWDTPWGLGLFFGLLALEWIVRKRAGLP
jgi:hypothetical protein